MSSTSGIVTVRSLLAIVAVVATFGGYPRQGLAEEKKLGQAAAPSAAAPLGTKTQTPTTALPATTGKGSPDGKSGSSPESPAASKNESDKDEKVTEKAGDKSGKDPKVKAPEPDGSGGTAEGGKPKAAEPENAFCKTNCVSWAAVGFLSILYLWMVVFAKDKMVANPTRQNFLAKVDADIVELANMTASVPPPSSVVQINALKKQLEDIKASLPPKLSWREFWCWSGGAELAGWNSVHAIACQRIFYVDRPNEIAVELIAAEDVLRLCKDGKDAIANALADRIKEALPNLTSAVDASDLPKLKALLAQAKGNLYDIEDTNFSDLSTAYNKTYWLVVCGLVVITAIGIIFGNGGFLLVGALGGLLSRLTYSYQRPASPNDYGASWSRFFLSPVVGALTGWSGILLVVLLHKLNILGAFFNDDWCDPHVVTFGIAFAFGFSERLFTDVFSQIENKLDPKENKTALKENRTNPNASDGSSAPKPLLVSGSTVPAKADRSFEINCVASGGAGGYKWKWSATPATGVTLDSQGKLIGSLPPAPSSLTMQVTVTDSKNTTAEGTYVVN